LPPLLNALSTQDSLYNTLLISLHSFSAQHSAFAMIFPKFLLSPVTKLHVERKVLHNRQAWHLFRIIQDVDAYSDFLPFCQHSRVIQRHDGNYQSRTQTHVFDATLTVGTPPPLTLRETYVSRVTVRPQTLTIESKSIQSKLFDSLRSQWILQDVSEQHYPHSKVATDVQCQVEITVRDPIMAATLDSFLQQVAKRQIEAFEKRSLQVTFDDDNDISRNKQ
jgi:ribosome-associated toxin RatA of RatAB toxin-antitoxin module